MSGEHHIHFSSATVWTGAENVPPIGSWVGGGGGGGEHKLSRVIFGLFRCHSSFWNASIRFKRGVHVHVSDESLLNQR